MKGWQNIKHFTPNEPYGALATVNLLICIVSGIVLALPFDVNHPFSSVTQMMIHNPSASFFRNMHYWSAQFFLILILLHIRDHFRQESEKKVSNGIWILLTLSILFVFYAMLSGFMLKGDADSIQAMRILNDLLSGIPLMGKFLAYLFIGTEGNFHILYLHHLGTATIFLIIITWEHARQKWVRWDTFIILLVLIILISLFIRAPLHDGHDPVVKGPWYFTGLQEILHWLKHPGLTLFPVAGLLVIIGLIPSMKASRARMAKYFLLYTFILYGIFTIIGFYFRGENWSWRLPLKYQYQNANRLSFSAGLVRTVFFPRETLSTGTTNHGPVEGCLICHSGVSGFSPAHDPQTIGCSACHLGNAYTKDKLSAHRGMILIPGNLDDTRITCGTMQCHPDIHTRMQGTLMTTLSGMITVDKYVFGEENDLSALHHVSKLEKKYPTAAETHLRNLCAACHLGNKKTETGPVDEYSRGGGCNACHLNYTDSSFNALRTYKPDKSDSTLPGTHPSLSLNITNNHCFGCHSRSGRISTGYEGWHETTLEPEDTVHLKKFRIIEDSRVFTYVSEDVHHSKGMDCIDCHNAYELMGNDSTYRHEEDQVTIRCEDCHRTEPLQYIQKTSLDPLSAKIAGLRKITADSFITEKKSGLAMLQIEPHGDSLYLRTKNSGLLLPLKSPAKECSRDNAHSRLSCSACHTSWAPSCIGCHNTFEKNTAGFDLLHQNMPVTGTWIEYTGEYNADPPALGIISSPVHENGQSETIRPAIPGMILSVDHGSFPKSIKGITVFHRLFAPSEPHTISAKGRACRSCHNNSQAPGYGKGELTYRIINDKGYWSFRPHYAAEAADSLPADAWTGFLSERKDQASTRKNFRPFTVEEQEKILTVGACLTCHKEDSELMRESLHSFPAVLKRISEKCILPDWKNQMSK